jgi:hypothetical protein
LIVPGLNSLQFSTHSDGGAYSWGFDVFRGDDLIYRNRDGEKENMDIYPSGAHFHTQAVCCNSLVMNHNFGFYVP